MLRVGDQYKDGKVVSIVGTSVTYLIPVEGKDYKHIKTDYVSREDQATHGMMKN